MPIDRIDHVQLAMPVGGEAAARAFYSDLLGLPETPKPPHLARRGGCWFESERVKVHLGVEQDHRPARKAHPALLVTDLPDLVARLTEAAVELVTDEPLDGYDRVYAYDPFGNRLELLQPQHSARTGMTDTVPGEQRVAFDLEAYVRRVQEGGCFICGIVDGDPERPAHIVYRDDRHIAFLPNWHVLLGYVLVAPVDHVEAVAGDFTVEEYLDLQRLVHRVARTVTLTVPTERVYILSLGSQQGNAHVHWHVASLPPGVAYEEQQYAALMVETKGHLAMTPDEQSSLAQQLRSVIRTVD